MGEKQTTSSQANRLLYSLAEELKLPLVQVAKQSELGKITKSLEHYKNIEVMSDAALQLIDGYIISLNSAGKQQHLQLSSVPITSLLYTSYDRLAKLSKLYGAEINIAVEGKCGLVMANKKALEAAISSLVYTFICGGGEKTKITLMAKESGGAILTGVYSNKTNITKKTLKKARELYGSARQPLASVTHGQGAGVYLADTLFSSMDSRLEFSQYSNRRGLLAALMPSRQLSLL